MQQDSNDPTKGVVRARERKATAALQLRTAGASWEEIADTLGYPTARSALLAVEKALEKELRTDESRAQMRDMAGRRLERLLRSAWGKATNPRHPEHLQAMARSRDIIDRHIKLYGLDAPAEVVIHSPSMTELEEWVARVVQADAPALEEANIFDVEFEEDDDDAASA
jgi:hypothetical protein